MGQKNIQVEAVELKKINKMFFKIVSDFTAEHPPDSVTTRPVQSWPGSNLAGTDWAGSISAGYKLGWRTNWAVRHICGPVVHALHIT